MDFYTPLFSQVVESSLWAEPDHVVKMFMTLLALKDRDHVVRYTAFALGKKCWPKDLLDGVAERRAMDALDVLMKPDLTRIEPQPFEGRRVERVADGYMVLNGEFYRKQMQAINTRASNAARQARHREKKKPVGVAYKSRERRFVKAEGSGDHKAADAIAAEGT